MKLKILQIGNPILREKARSLTADEIKSNRIQDMILHMQETMYDAPGVGLAAPQIGESLQIIVIEDREIYHKTLSDEVLTARERKPIPFHIIINPSIVSHSSEKIEFYEGCLSFHGFVGLVARYKEVQINFLNEVGETIIVNASGWYARILQHEIDHLTGCLCVDRMNIKSLTTIENFNKFHNF